MSEPNPVTSFQPVDVAILTVMQEEFNAVRDVLQDCQRFEGTEDSPNLLSWELGNIQWENHPHSYRCVLAQVGHSATTFGALAAIETIERWKPRFFFFVGIAGGFKKNGMKLGDIAISDIIWGYEYGKVRDSSFRPRIDLTYRADTSLKTGALSFAGRFKWINRHLQKSLQEQRLAIPNITPGPIASGDKVIDDPSSDFFQNVLQVLENTIAVEMEGIGAGLACAQSHDKGHRVSFLMIRAISDVPDRKRRPRGKAQSAQRQKMKQCAATIAATFTAAYIRNGLPVPPSEAKQPLGRGHGSPERRQAFLEQLSKIHLARLRAQQAIIKWQNQDGGIPATQPGQASGPWTTASCLEALLDGPSIVPDVIKNMQTMKEYLLREQRNDGGWQMFDEQESCTLTTGHTVSALMSVRSHSGTKADKRLQGAIYDGMQWLSNHRSIQGGWCIKPLNRTNPQKPSILATYYALRPFLRDTSTKSGKLVEAALKWMLRLRKTDGHLPSTQSPDRQGLSNTARFLISILLFRDYKLNQTFFKTNQPMISSGMRVLTKSRPRSMKAWPADIESYIITASKEQSPVHNNTTCDVLEALVRCKCSYSQIMEPVDWLLKGQDEAGPWRLQSPDGNPNIFPATTWSTSEFLYVLNLVAVSLEEELEIR